MAISIWDGFMGMNWSAEYLREVKSHTGEVHD